ncbi:MAG: glucose-6-phosphate dehydrogenase assembly protein OpcA [Verrucomicrobiales bacterium]
MAPSTTLPDLPAFQRLGKPVEISRIEKELQNLFLDDTDPEAGGIARASLINLALYNEDQNQLEQDSEILAELTSDAACRSILISSDTGIRESGARAWVQVHCQIDRNGNKTVCTEQISFFLTGDSPGLLRNIVFANLDSDLPLAFWWRGEFSDAFEELLYSRIDRLLFDSESWESPRNQFIRLESARKSTTKPFVMHDFAFTRLNSIRHAVANAFDGPAVAQKLGSLGEISIRYRDGYRMSALYLAGWIASRLDATVDKSQSTASRIVFGSNRAASPSSYRLHLEKMAAERKGTVEVDFVFRDCRVEISRCQSRDFLRTLVHRTDAKTEENWLPAKKTTDASLVADILNRAGRNRTHAQVLPLVQELLTL